MWHFVASERSGTNGADGKRLAGLADLRRTDADIAAMRSAAGVLLPVTRVWARTRSRCTGNSKQGQPCQLAEADVSSVDDGSPRERGHGEPYNAIERVSAMPIQRPRLLILRGSAETNGVVFQSGPLHEQLVRAGSFNGARERLPDKARHRRNNQSNAIECCLKIFFLAGNDGKQSVFGHHRAGLADSRSFSAPRVLSPRCNQLTSAICQKSRRNSESEVYRACCWIGIGLTFRAGVPPRHRPFRQRTPSR